MAHGTLQLLLLLLPAGVLCLRALLDRGALVVYRACLPELLAPLQRHACGALAPWLRQPPVFGVRFPASLALARTPTLAGGTGDAAVPTAAFGTVVTAQSFALVERFLELLPPKPQPLAVRYGVSALLTACSLVVFVAMEAQSGFICLYILLPAIFVAGVMFDRGSAFVATGLAVGGVLWLLRLQLSSALALPLVLFAFVSLAFAAVAELLRNEMEKVVASERSKTLLLQEVAHRTKNNLAMLSAMVRLQSRTLGQEASDALDMTSQRIQTMAEVYDHLMLRDQTKIVDLKEYVSDIVRRLMALSGDKPVALRCELDEAYAHSEVAVPIAIIINELVTNSIKYGFPDEQPGQILIELHVDDELVLSVSDNGIGMPDPELAKKGIGSKVVALLTEQLNGKLVYEDAQPGCRVVLRMQTPKL